MNRNIKGLIFFGDSILAGTGASSRDLCCAKLIKEALKIPVSLRARNWNTSQDGVARLESEVLTQKNHSHVIILFGNNDCWLTDAGQSKVDLKQTIANLQWMANCILKNFQTPIFCNLQPINIDKLFKRYPHLCTESNKHHLSKIQATYNDEIEKTIANMKLDLVDIRSKLEDEINEVLADDGLHPNDRGHKIIADAIIARLIQIDPVLHMKSNAC